jgi:hypothetical protein
MGSLIKELFGQGPKVSGRSRYGAPDRKTQKIPLRTHRSFTRSRPRSLFERNGLMAAIHIPLPSWLSVGGSAGPD